MGRNSGAVRRSPRLMGRHAGRAVCRTLTASPRKNARTDSLCAAVNKSPLRPFCYSASNRSADEIEELHKHISWHMEADGGDDCVASVATQSDSPLELTR
eukprot:gnl/TRDRNA2_/TRDRNA2_32475_c0_seq1.p1 gnl/TRDRNA2_/TRDRNA2_32475_c0~~gnl/TRDRNA2_/TRDRNA2_32475_c0_seq1.p1  ORF type:complete len:100 (-),score=6.66 gnl/TRDRNA2_/TRDRNA2_32475_c0_seq1:6-305(-)